MLSKIAFHLDSDTKKTPYQPRKLGFRSKRATRMLEAARGGVGQSNIRYQCVSWNENYDPKKVGFTEPTIDFTVGSK